MYATKLIDVRMIISLMLTNCSILLNGASGISGHNYKAIRHYKSNNPFWTGQASSLVNCATNCFPDNGCVAFNYQAGSKMCETSSESPSDSDQLLTSATGWTTYFIQGECPSGWLTFYTSCYFVAMQMETSTDAKSYCDGLGAHLAKIQNEEETAFIIDNLQSRGAVNFWLEGSDAVQDGVWLWEDNSAMTYFNWKEEEPNNDGGQEDCLVFYPPAPSGHWMDVRCQSRNNILCEKQAEIRASIPGKR